MSNYSIQLRKVCDIYTREEVEKWFKSYNLEDYLLPKQLELVKTTPIWNKERLAKKIVNHYFMREIGFETPALFKLNAINLMNEIMEEKLQYIYTIAIEYDPLINVDFTETFNRNSNSNTKGNETDNLNSTNNLTSEGESNSHSNGNSSGLTLNSDTPQTKLTKSDILKGEYASTTTANENENNITDNTTTSNTQNNTSSSTANKNSNFDNTNKEEYTRHLTGNQGISATYQAMIKQFRDNIKAIDREIINELNVLFMGLY